MCFRYLTSEPFRARTEGVLQHARQGYYGFQDYAVQYCLYHLQSCTGLESHEYVLQQTMECAREFLAVYSLPTVPNVAALSHHDISNFFNRLPQDKRERSDNFTLGYRTLDIRTVIERIHLEELPPEEKALIRTVYGEEITYKCHKIWCDYFSTGFDKIKDREKHLDSHDRPFCCSEEGCFAFQLGYASKNKLEEHVMKFHIPVEKELQFPQAMRRRHNDTLLNAAGRNDLGAMLALLEAGAPVDGTSSKAFPENQFPVCRAAKNGHVEACKLLLEWRGSSGGLVSGFSVNLAMNLAIGHDHPDVVRCLVSEPMIENDPGNFSIWVCRACRQGKSEIVRILLESSSFRAHGVEEWEPFASNWLLQVCYSSADHPDNIAIVKYLLEKGFSGYVRPELLTIVKKLGGEYLESLLRPIFDLNASSNLQAGEKAEHLAHEHGGGSNHALQYYQMQLLLLEQQDKKRRMMENQERDRYLT